MSRLGPAPTKRKKLRAPSAIVRAFWERMEARDWEGARLLLADDLVVIWPATAEKFDGADTFIAMNQAYPGDWHVEVQRVNADGRHVLAWIEVHVGDERAFCAQQVVVTDKKIRSSIDLWVDEGESEPPAWRVDLMSRIATKTTSPAPSLHEEAS
ncbi:nuclear transport factor 2 family protein [Aquihabitans sp. McL0605]|uniref:nuclear transport factor 2 family protein n=1 Tax=Aquihabitans sp. McL0605 TaxID=3415671 RepID=UPI003CF04450